ncbi:hypothetical protein FOQG_19628 [Fusarium oxysporum f. sp. raphani 54005]|uniref:Transcription factor domain-containing protein n=1 Tax=Fusarium oxysporum f. sp. raphani 54005 TaxID=1089458 RepID=X0B0F4_FUSOX|nr:hypothetical protein FOQG_19628 [Fusarium oxysporum f. sp. raphani 54005]
MQKKQFNIQSQSPLRFENECCEDSVEYDDAIQSGDDVDKLTCTEIQQGIKSTSLDRDTGIAHSPLGSVDCSISPTKATALMPIPSDPQFSPQDSLLWSYFVVRGTKIFLCWDVDKFGLNELVDDPFTATFTSMAAHSTVLRPAAFALSAFLYSQDCPGALSSDDVAAFKHQALSAFEQEEPELKKKPIDFVLAGLVLQLVDGDRHIGQ